MRFQTMVIISRLARGESLRAYASVKMKYAKEKENLDAAHQNAVLYEEIQMIKVEYLGL